jgi:hypothetical protein
MRLTVEDSGGSTAIFLSHNIPVKVIILRTDSKIGTALTSATDLLLGKAKR